MQLTYSSETGKFKQHIRDTDIDGRTINKNMELLTKTSRIMFASCGVCEERANGGL